MRIKATILGLTLSLISFGALAGHPRVTSNEANTVRQVVMAKVLAVRQVSIEVPVRGVDSYSALPSSVGYVVTGSINDPHVSRMVRDGVNVYGRNHAQKQRYQSVEGYEFILKTVGDHRIISIIQQDPGTIATGDSVYLTGSGSSTRVVPVSNHRGGF